MFCQTTHWNAIGRALLSVSLQDWVSWVRGHSASLFRVINKASTEKASVDPVELGVNVHILLDFENILSALTCLHYKPVPKIDASSPTSGFLV